MTVLTLYRVPRRFVRKLLKPLALRLNAWRFACSEHEAYRLLVTAESLRRAEAKEYRLSLLAGFGRRKAIARAVRVYRFGF